MCEGTDADKGVLAQKTELPGIYPDLLAPMMMMTNDHGHDELDICVKIMKQYSVLSSIQGL